MCADRGRASSHGASRVLPRPPCALLSVALLGVSTGGRSGKAPTRTRAALHPPRTRGVCQEWCSPLEPRRYGEHKPLLNKPERGLTASRHSHEGSGPPRRRLRGLSAGEETRPGKVKRPGDSSEVWNPVKGAVDRSWGGGLRILLPPQVNRRVQSFSHCFDCDPWFKILITS